jgi:hypothetical protein
MTWWRWRTASASEGSTIVQIVGGRNKIVFATNSPTAIESVGRTLSVYVGARSTREIIDRVHQYCRAIDGLNALKLRAVSSSRSLIRVDRLVGLGAKGGWIRNRRGARGDLRTCRLHVGLWLDASCQARRGMKLGRRIDGHRIPGWCRLRLFRDRSRDACVVRAGVNHVRVSVVTRNTTTIVAPSTTFERIGAL